MADRVHPADSPARPSTSDNSLAATSSPPPGTYVVQIPKDQVYRLPPPENAKRFQQLTRRKHRKSRCRCCFCSLLAFLVSFVFLLGIAAGVFYLVVRPESPKYSINAMAIKGINLTSSAATSISPEIDVLFRADNPNDKIGIYYERQSSAIVFYSDVKLCEGALPVVYQPSNNETVLQTALKGSAIELSSSVHKSLYDSQNQGKVLLKVDVHAPVKLKIGSLKTWKITVRVSCEVTVDKLATGSKIVSQKCDYSVKLW